MTTFNALSDRLSAPAGRLVSATFYAVAVAAAIVLSGCSGSGIGLGDAPAPQSTLTDGPKVAGTSQLAKFAVAPIIGAPEAFSRDLQTQLATSLERRGVTVAKTATEKSEYTLRGYIVAAKERSKVKVSYIWDVTDGTGKRVNRMTGEESAAANSGKDPWAAIGSPLIAAIADKTAGSMATWAGTQSAIPVASATPQATGLNDAYRPSSQSSSQLSTAAIGPPPSQGVTGGPATGSIERDGSFTTVIPPVTGAPGDGSSSLTQAIQKELSRNGVPLSEQRTASAYRVEGRVSVGAGRDGKQPIQIDWNVIDPAGKKLGTVSQKNEIPQGSLDGPWGRTADAAASAAAQGILKLLPKTRTN